jgi:arylsulfatase A-like enzyme
MYMALASLVDEQIGRLLDALETRGILDDTVILFTTDHGDMLGDHSLHHKFHHYEGSSRTPIIVRRPGRVPPSATLPGLAESADLPHTILDIAGLSPEERAASLPESPGVSFWEYCRQGGEAFRESAYSETRGNSRMLRCGDWKYTRFPGKGDHLYNLAADPHELCNLADSPDGSAKRRQLQEMLIDRMVSTRVPPIQGKFRGDEIIRKIRKGT